MNGTVFGCRLGAARRRSATTRFDLQFAPGYAAPAVVNAGSSAPAAATGEITPSDRATVSAAGGRYVARVELA